ncbi:MAG: hypothetical protein HY308_19045 [Gammaproteobacteria bacterium]|nr:hypothetical protein [Gammaproteobacteria bacterium]
MKIFRLLVVLMLAFGSIALAHADDKYYLQAAEYDATAHVMGRVRTECGIEGLLDTHVLEQVKQRFPASERLDSAAPVPSGQVLSITILNVGGIGGGPWTGAKSITVRAELKRDGKVLSSVVKNRQSKGHPMQFGTCSIFERCAKALGKDITGWLVKSAKSPSTSPSENNSPTAPTEEQGEPKAEEETSG